MHVITLYYVMSNSNLKQMTEKSHSTLCRNKGKALRVKICFTWKEISMNDMPLTLHIIRTNDLLNMTLVSVLNKLIDETLLRLLSTSKLAVQSTANYILTRDILLLAISTHSRQQ